ncbi:MAG: hypothetical protein ACRCZF_14145, partial [Gemmataceae bacterium]
ALADCESMIAAILNMRDTAANPEDSSGASDASPGSADPRSAATANGADGPGVRVPNGSITAVDPTKAREEIYARLLELAALLEKIEPHSPVPFLIRRAVEMRALQFPALVDALQRGGTMLDFLRNPLQTS